MSENEINLIRQVDGAKLTPDKHIETKYGLGTIRNLSSGCRTLLNIVKHPEKYRIILVGGDSGTGKTVLYEMLED